MRLRATRLGSASTGRGIAPTLVIDFTTGVLAPMVTFSRASSGSRFNSSGLMVFESANVPRFDYDPVTLAARGLLIEPQRTNFIVWSENYDDSSWSKADVTVTANQTASPTGAATADAVVENTAADLHAVYRFLYFAELTKYTHSVFFKSRERIFAYITIGEGINRQAANIDLTTGAVTSAVISGNPAGAGYSARMSSNGFVRAEVEFTTTVNSALCLFGSSNSANPAWNSYSDVVYSGDGASGIYAWGSQLEQGKDATSYIPTTTAEVTRSADVVSIALPYNCDLLVQDGNGGEWRKDIPAGAYNLLPRAGSGYHVKRVGVYPPGTAARAPFLAVAA